VTKSRETLFMAKILVTGSLGWDVPIWLEGALRSGGRIRARTLEADGETGGFPGRLGGGAANIAAALVRVGHEVWVCGRVGDDVNGRRILDGLAIRGIQTEFIDASLPSTPSAQILIEPSGERTIIGFSTSAAHSAPELHALSHDFDCHIQRGGGTRLGVRPPLIVAHVPTYGAYNSDADVVVGGRSDLAAGAENAPLATVRQQFPHANWGIITNGAGSLIAQSDSHSLEIVPQSVAMLDATGAGDVFMAGLTDALLAGATMESACRHGAMWGGICVGLEGSAAAPDEARYEAFIHEPSAI
jgi:sugar/nucleoside kinase (ribokinase family)